jgi:hypothetical protein
MDLSHLDANDYALIVVDRNTGIVLNPETLERWTERGGGKNHLQMGSLEEARLIAKELVSVRTDLEATIFDRSGGLVEMIRPDDHVR